MKIIFSPSKSQKISKPEKIAITTKVLFGKKSEELRNRISGLSLEDIKSLFNVSDKKSMEIACFYKHTINQSAIKTFTGNSYREINFNNYDSMQQKYFQDHVAILSAMYGILQPYDQILPYRLDMNDAIVDDSYQNLYEFWGMEIDEYFKNEDCIINLASLEYAKMLKNIDQSKIITIHFLVHKNGIEKTISTISKQQRGKMLDFMVQNNIIKLSDIKKYNKDNFAFHQNQSDDNNIVFVQNTC